MRLDRIVPREIFDGSWYRIVDNVINTSPAVKNHCDYFVMPLYDFQCERPPQTANLKVKHAMHSGLNAGVLLNTAMWLVETCGLGSNAMVSAQFHKAISTQKLATKHRKVLLNKNRLPTKTTLSLHYYDWSPLKNIFAEKYCSSSIFC